MRSAGALALAARRPRSTRSSTAAILWYPEPGRPARALHEINVIGTLQLLAACERTETLRSGDRARLGGDLRLRGGGRRRSSPRTWPAALPLRTRFQRDISELEEYFDNFARRHPRLTCCMLRYQPEIGPGLDSPLVRYLSLPVVPVQLGFDPRLQLLHADDATGALEAAVANPVRGAGQRRPDGLDLAEPRAAAVAPPVAARSRRRLFEPLMARLGARLGAGGAGRRRGPAAALRARRRQLDGCATRSASSRASTRPRDRGPRRRRRRRPGSARACIRVASPRGSRELVR